MDDQFILEIMEKFNNSGITELVLDDGTTHLVLKKEQTAVSGGKAAGLPAAEGSAGNAVHLGIPVNARPAGDGEKITSPIVGTFYPSPSPDSPPFVKPGAKVKAGQTLCILEAMKMMNHLEAEFDCEIAEVLVSGGEMVEYGQALFTVKRL